MSIQFDFDIADDTNPQFIENLAANNGVDILDYRQGGPGGGNGQYIAICGDKEDGKKFLTYLYDKDSWEDVVYDYGDFGLGDEVGLDKPKGGSRFDTGNSHCEECDGVGMIGDDPCEACQGQGYIGLEEGLYDMASNIAGAGLKPFKKTADVVSHDQGDDNVWNRHNAQQNWLAGRRRKPSYRKPIMGGIHEALKNTPDSRMDRQDNDRQQRRNTDKIEAQAPDEFEKWFDAAYDYADANVGMSPKTLSNPSFMEAAEKAFRDGIDPYSFISEYSMGEAEYNFMEEGDAGMVLNRRANTPDADYDAEDAFWQSGPEMKGGMGFMGHQPTGKSWEEGEKISSRGARLKRIAKAQSDLEFPPKPQQLAMFENGDEEDDDNEDDWKEHQEIEMWEDEVWAYAQEHYGVSAQHLNLMAERLQEYFDNDVPPEDTVDELFGPQAMAEAHGENQGGKGYGHMEKEIDRIDRKKRASKSDRAAGKHARMGGEQEVDADPFFGNKEANDYEGFQDPTSSKRPTVPPPEPEADPLDSQDPNALDMEELPSTWGDDGSYSTPGDDVTFPEYEGDPNYRSMSRYDPKIGRYVDDAPDEHGFYPRAPAKKSRR